MKNKQRFIHKVLMSVLIFMLTFGGMPVEVLSETSGENQGVEGTIDSTSETFANDLLDKHEVTNLPEDAEYGQQSNEVVQEEVTSDKTSGEDDPKESFEKEDIEKKTGIVETEVDTKKTYLQRVDRSASLVMTEWHIKNGSDQSLNETLPAISNSAYDLYFEAEMAGASKGDTFKLTIPEVASVTASDHFFMQVSDWVNQKDSSDKVIYKYRVINKDGTSIQEIEFEMLENLQQSFEIKHYFPGMLKSFVKTEGTYVVSFGKDTNGKAFTRNIKFEQNKLTLANGYSYKYSTGTSNNSVRWGIQVNGAGNLELAGDEVDFTINGGTGNKYQGFFMDNPLRTSDKWHEWGTNYTDIFAPDLADQTSEADYGVYVEDEFPKGANISQITIASVVNIPVGIGKSDLLDQKGGITTTGVAFNSYVLADYGNGPLYREGGDNGVIQKPKTGTGFKLLKQRATETKSTFKERVQAEPYQYGVYTDGNDRETIMIHFGKMKSAEAGNEQEKLSDQTDEKYSGKTFEDKDGIEREIPQFAVEAATATIVDGRAGYTEADRDLLERYFTLVYGDNNAVKGAIAAYTIGINVKYAPETGGSLMNTSSIYSHNALTQNRKTPKTMPEKNEATATLKNPFGYIKVSPNEVMLQKLDAGNFEENGDFIGINSAQFKLQKKTASGWEDLKNPDDPSGFWTTGSITYNDGKEDQVADGLVKVDVNSLSNVPDNLAGTYRFVETKAAVGFSETDSPNWSNKDQAIVSDEFYLPAPTSSGPIVTVWNRRKEASYKVQHWVQKDSVTNVTSTDDFELRETEVFESQAGLTVTGEPLEKIQLTHFYDAVFSAAQKSVSGTVPDPTDGEELILRLYYTKDQNIPFTVYKLGGDGEPLKKTVDSTVKFKVYRWMYKKDPLLPSNAVPSILTHPPTDQNIADKYWQPVLVKADGSLVSQDKAGSAAADLDEFILETDELGRIRDERLIYSTDFGAQLGLVEIENSHKGYEVPKVTEKYWVAQLIDPNNSNTLGQQGVSWVREVENANSSTPGTYTSPLYKPQSSTTTYKALRNTYDVSGKVFKIDENGKPMVSTSEQKVSFDIYEYTGPDTVNNSSDTKVGLRPDWATNNATDYNNPLNTSKIRQAYPIETYPDANNPGFDFEAQFKSLWKKVATAITDGNGEIINSSDGTPLALDKNEFYSFVETSTLDGYQIPNNHQFSPNRTSHWLVSLSGKLRSGAGYVDSRGKGYFDEYYENQLLFKVTKDGIFLINRKLSDIPIFKVDENLKPILQNSADNFRFETYLYKGGYKDGKNYTNQNFTTTASWIKVSTETLADSFSVGGAGRLFSENQSFEKLIGRSDIYNRQVVGIREVNGMYGYEKSEGYWVAILEWDSVAKVNKVTSLEYFTGFVNGAAVPYQLAAGETAENNRHLQLLNGKAYLKNTKKPAADFSFIKENMDQEGLGGVEFALYKSKDEDGEENPALPNNMWDVTEEPYREAISSTDSGNMGQVDFKSLASGKYLLIETKPLEGYREPDGCWVITINAETTDPKLMININAIGSPPAFRVDESGTTYKYYLPNFIDYILPSAGGRQMIFMTSLGIMLMGFGVWYNLSSNDQKVKKLLKRRP